MSELFRFTVVRDPDPEEPGDDDWIVVEDEDEIVKSGSSNSLLDDGGTTEPAGQGHDVGETNADAPSPDTDDEPSKSQEYRDCVERLAKLYNAFASLDTVTIESFESLIASLTDTSSKDFCEKFEVCIKMIAKRDRLPAEEQNALRAYWTVCQFQKERMKEGDVRVSKMVGKRRIVRKDRALRRLASVRERSLKGRPISHKIDQNQIDKALARLDTAIDALYPQIHSPQPTKVTDPKTGEPTYAASDDTRTDNPDGRRFRALVEEANFRDALEILREQRPVEDELEIPYQEVVDTVKMLIFASAAPDTVPTGIVRKIGVQELMVVRKDIIRYEPREIAHVENVLKGENRIRTHTLFRSEEREARTLRASEQFEETATSKTDATSLEKETQREIQTRAQLTASVQSTARGPNIDVTTAVESGLQVDSATAVRQANSRAREISQAAVKRVIEKFEKEVLTRSLIEVREESKHEFLSPRRNVVGIYQHLDAVYQCQVYRLDARLLLELIIPEPGIALRGTSTQSEGEPVFAVTTSDIKPSTFRELARRFEATDVPAPPATTIEEMLFTEILAKDNVTETLTVPARDGYVIDRITVRPSAYDGGTSHDNYVALTVGNVRRTLYADQPNVHWGLQVFQQTAGDDYSVVDGPLAVSFYKKGGLIASFHVKVRYRVSSASMEEWRSQVRDELYAGYIRQLTAYRERKTREGEVPPRSPSRNRLDEREEIKRLACSILSGLHLDSFDSYPDRDDDFPRVDFKILGQQQSIIAFLEQAIEWEFILYQLYSYFWGEKGTWEHAVTRASNDPLRDEFLRAGAARVQLPVRPGWQDLIEEFLVTGQVPSEFRSDVFVNTDEYLSIVDEVRQRSGGGEVGCPEGEPWELRVPMASTLLRKSGELPVWLFDLATGQSQPEN